MNNQQGRTDDKNKKDEQRRGSDEKKPNDPKTAGDKSKNDATSEKRGVPDGQQHGGSGRGMNRDDAEAGTGEQKEARGKPFGNVRKTENQGAESAGQHGDKNTADKSKDASKSAAGAADANAVDEDEAEGDTSGPKAKTQQQ